MSGVYKKARAALENRLSTTVGVPAISWENVSFEPTTGTQFLKPMFQPTSRMPAVRGLNPQQRYQGIFTILCYYPENSGPGTSQTLVDTLVERFDATTDITYSDIILSIDYAEQNPSYSNPPWYITPITIGWYLYE